MSFFNDSSVCQSTANPINKFLDTSTKANLSNFRTDNIANNDIQTFHQYRNLDTSVQNEFHQFTESAKNSLHFNVTPQGITGERFLNNTRRGQLETFNGTQQDWSKDFMNLNLRDNHERPLQQPQFMNQNNSTLESFQSQHRHEPLRNISHFPLNQSGLTLNKNIESLRQKNTQIQYAELNNEFDTAFTEVEEELNTDSQKVDENCDQHSLEGLSSSSQVDLENTSEDQDKTKFADLAKNVFDIMNNTPKGVSMNTSNKFKQSGFMQLMNKISSREIEISNDKNKFVDQHGVDIRTKIDDPLQNLGADDEPLKTPFEAASKVSRNVDSNAWQGDFI